MRSEEIKNYYFYCCFELLLRMKHGKFLDSTVPQLKHVFGQCEADGCGCKCWLSKSAVRLCNHLKEENDTLFLKNGC
jgi:hypothetical protein